MITPAPTLSLAPNLAIAESPDAIADRLERVAAELRKGVYPGAHSAILLFAAEQGCYVRTYGRPTTTLSLVGLLEFAKNDIITGNDLEPLEPRP